MTHAADHKPRPGKSGAQAQRSAAKAPASAMPEPRPAQAQRLGGSYAMGPTVGLRSPVQAKLTVGQSGDRYEREADSVAERVATGQPTGDVSRIPPGGLQSQRAAEGGADAAPGAKQEEQPAQAKCAACEAKEAQRKQDAGADDKGDENAQMKCAACEGKEKKQAAQREGDEGGEQAQQAAQREEDEGGEQAQQTAQREGDEGGEQAQQAAQREEEEGGEQAQQTAQREGDEGGEQAQQAAQREEDEGGEQAQQTAQREEDEGGEQAQEAAQREEDEGGEQAQQVAQREGDGDEQAQETAQRKEDQGGDQVQELAQRQDAEESEADEAEENQPDEAAADEEGQKECGEAEGEGAGGGAHAGAQGGGATGGGATEEGAEGEEGASEEGAGGAGAERDDLGCGGGEGGEGGEAEAAPGGGGGGCAAPEAAGEGGEGAAGGPEGGAAATAGPTRPPAATGSVPGCAEEVEADREDESPAEGGEAAAPESGAPAASGECAQRQEGDDSDVTPVQEKKDERAQGSKPSPRRRGLDTGTASTLIHARGAGEPLAPAVRQRVEGSLGVDLGGVRVHSDGNAQSAARALRAKAFTTRNHIFLGPGQSKHDVNLMAHESTHVLQQDAVARRKPEPGSGAGGGPSLAKGPAPSGGASVPMPALPPKAAESSQGPAERSEQNATPRAATPPSTPPAASKGAAAKAPSAAAASGAAPMAGAMAARPPAAATSATAAATADVSPARAPVMSRSIAPPDPSAFTGEPSDSLTALASLSPVRAPFAFRMFRTGVDGSLKRRRASEHRDAPHGRYEPRSPNLPHDRPAPESVAAGPAPVAGAFGPAPIPSPGKVTVASENAGPTPSVDTAAHEREVDAVDEKKPNAIEIVRAWMRRFFAGVPTSDSNVNTDPGPVPTITYTKDSDPAQVQTIEDENDATVQHRLEEADEKRDDDFGEYDVEPELEDGEEKIPVPAHVHKMGTGCDPEADAEPLAFDPPHEAELAARVHAETGSRWTAEEDSLDASEDERDRKVAGERMALPGRLADAHAEAYRQEDTAAGAARAEVNRLRASWGDENRGVQTRFDEQSTCDAGCARGAIKDQVALEDGKIAERHLADKTAAETEKKRVEEQARLEKEEAERKAKEESSGGLLSRGIGWIKNKAKSALAWVAKKVKGLFDKLRTWVREQFEKFKKWVNEQIEKARRWINEKLEWLRRKLHALVDKYLGEYPGIAKRFHSAIDSSIDAAQAAVNRAADRLKRTVNKLIDAAAKAVDVALAVTEKVVVGALTVACDIVVVASNLTLAFVEGDLQSMIVLVRELPDWPPLFGGLMSVVRAGFLGFLERMHAKPADVKKRFVEKLRGLLTSGKYYGGVFLGILNGLIVDGLWGTITMIYDIITKIPQIITDIHDAIRRLASDVEAIAAIADRFRATEAEVRAFLDRPESAQEMIAMLKRSPEILVAMIDKALHEGREWSYRAGAKAADALFNWILTASNYDIGLAVGTFIGRVIFEVLLLVFTAGAGTAIKWGGKALQMLLKGLSMLTRGLRGAGGWAMKGIRLLREIVMAGLAAARKLGGTIKKVLAKVGELVDKVFDWFRRAFGRIGRKLMGKASPQERARWRAFKLEVTQALAGHPNGMTKNALKGIYRGIITRYRDVVGWPTVITKKGAYWRLWARPKKGLRPRQVGRMLQDRDTRWKQGKKAVDSAIKGLKRRVDNIDAGQIDAALVPVKAEFRYSVLQSRFDESDNEFVVEGAMSGKKKVAKAKPKRPMVNHVAIKDDNKHVQVNPLVRKSATRSAPSGDPPHWPDVQPIKSVSGKTSLYRQGHLVSGYFLGGDDWNLTPITFSANSTMAARGETPVRKKLAVKPAASSSQPVYKYDVKATGSAAKGTLRNRLVVRGGKRVCETVSAERKLYKTITISIDAYGYNPSARKWNRTVALPPGASAKQPVPNVPPFPPGKACTPKPKPKPKKKKKAPKKKGKKK